MRFNGYLLLLLIVLFSCRKKNYDAVKIIGHAGSGLAVTNAPYHDNSLKSIQYALDMEGVDGVEVDIQCSADGTAWLFHDVLLNNQSNGSGCVNSQSDGYLETLQYTTTEQEPLSKLKELAFPFETKELFLDLRSSNECKNELIDVQVIVQAIQAALTNAPPAKIIVITNQQQWIHPFYQLGWTVFHEVEEVNTYLSGAYLSETSGVCMRNANISQDEVKTVQELGKQVFLFNVRSPKGIRSALKKYPDYLLTDDLKATLIEKY